jgi:hypothetical protein
MRSLLTFLVLITLVVANGSSVAAAVCRHQDALAHAAALQSGDEKVAAAAHTEETARSETSKKAAPADARVLMLAAYTLPPAVAAFPERLMEPSRPWVEDAALLAGRSIRPLLEPPSA